MLKRILSRTQDFLFPISCGLQATRLEAILEGFPEFTVKFIDWDKDIGAGSFYDLTVIAAITSALSPRIILEIGTGRGRSTIQFAANTISEAQIFTIDISTHPNIGCIFRNQPYGNKIQQLQGDSKTYNLRQHFPQADLILIDGAHDYESVICDSKTAFELIKTGGLILWDDFCPSWSGVVKALNQFTTTHKIYRIAGTKIAYHKARSSEVMIR